MEEYKSSVETRATKPRDPFVPDLSITLEEIRRVAYKKGEITEFSVSIIMGQLNGTLHSHRGRIPPLMTFAEFEFPQTLYMIYNMELNFDAHLSCLQAIDRLANEADLNAQDFINYGVFQSFISTMQNVEFHGGNEKLTEISLMLSIMSNLVLSDPRSAHELLSIGVSNSINVVLEKASVLNSNNVSDQYLERMVQDLFRLRLDLSNVIEDVEEMNQFILLAIAPENDFLTIRVFPIVLVILSRSLDATPLFTNDYFIHTACEFAFNHYDSKAIDVISEYFLFDEKLPQLHDQITALINNVDYNSLFLKINETFTGIDVKNRIIPKFTEPLLILIGNAIYKLESFPSLFEPRLLEMVFENVKMYGSIQEKRAVVFLQIIVWTRLPFALFQLLSTEEDLNFCLDVAINYHQKLAHYALELVNHLMKEATATVGPGTNIGNCVPNWLNEVIESCDSNSELAQELYNTYYQTTKQ